MNARQSRREQPLKTAITDTEPHKRARRAGADYPPPQRGRHDHPSRSYAIPQISRPLCVTSLILPSFASVQRTQARTAKRKSNVLASADHFALGRRGSISGTRGTLSSLCAQLSTPLPVTGMGDALFCLLVVRFPLCVAITPHISLHRGGIPLQSEKLPVSICLRSFFLVTSLSCPCDATVAV